MRALLVAIGLATTALIATVTPAFACTQVDLGVPRTSLATGTAFLASVVRTFEVSDPALGGDLHERTEFSVERVYRGNVPASYTIWTGKCHETRAFEAGSTYFISTKAVEGPSVEDTLAWRISPTGLELVNFEAFTSYPPEVLQVRTLDQAIRLTVATLPETDTASRVRPDGGMSPLGLVVATMAAVSTLMLWRRRVRVV
jgi:hypothetical protein